MLSLLLIVILRLSYNFDHSHNSLNIVYILQSCDLLYLDAACSVVLVAGLYQLLVVMVRQKFNIFDNFFFPSFLRWCIALNNLGLSAYTANLAGTIAIDL